MIDPHAFGLVLHHRYGNPEPHDLSGHGNYGYATAGRAMGRDGQLTGRQFDGVASRIYVRPSTTLTRPGGLRADVSVLVEELGHRRTLIEGYLSFALFVEGDGAIGAGIYRYKEWSGVQTPPGLVPLGSWITVSFRYTGDGVMTLSLNDEIVAESYRQLGDAAGIEWPFGLNIGAWPDGDQRILKGRVDEVRLWRTRPSRVG